MMALSGVRISWLILARNSDFAVDAFSAARLALRSSSCDFFHAVMSRMSAQNFGSLLADAAHRHVQRNQSAALQLADHVAAFAQRLRRAGARQPVETIARDARAVGREQVEEGCAGKRAGFGAENRANARYWPAGSVPARSTIENAVGGDIEDALEFGEFGFGGLDRAAAASAFSGAGTSTSAIAVEPS